MFVLNAFSLSMVALPTTIRAREIALDSARELLTGSGVESAVGHADTARVFSSLLGVEIPVNRVSVTIKPGEYALVGQLVGPRLSEGATTLPEGAAIRWIIVAVEEE